MLLGGVMADRFSRTRLLVVIDAVSGLCVLAVSAMFFVLPGDHWMLVPVLLVVHFVRGCCASLFHPVASALLPDLVAKNSINRANSTFQTSIQITILIGQVTGGVLYRLLGAPLLMLIDGVSFLLSALSELFIRDPERSTERPQKEFHLVRDLKDGWRFTGRLRGFRLYVFEASWVNLFISSLFVMLPFYVEDVLGVSPAWYGYLLSSLGMGVLVGGLIARRFPQPGKLRGTIQIVGLTYLSGCLAVLSFARTPIQAMAVLFTAWMCVGFHGVLLTTLIQKRTPSEYRGRVFSLLNLIRTGLMPIGMAIFGVLIDSLGDLTQLMFWCGCGGLAVILGTLLHPDYRWFFTGDENEVAMDESESREIIEDDTSAS